ncbi:HK97 gp10 family phage protein [Bacillus tianshenii]|nr:HK97 gp10 family phage protein [Bacillus tianshenii]
MEIEGLTEFQRDLLEVAQRKLPKESKKAMRKVGSKARTQVARRARKEVNKVTGTYQKRWKRGKVFIGENKEIVVRVYNSAPHAHLIEDGHRQVTKDGREVGFVRGKHVLEKSMKEFEDREIEKMLGDWLDGLLEEGSL